MLTILLGFLSSLSANVIFYILLNNTEEKIRKKTEDKLRKMLRFAVKALKERIFNSANEIEKTVTSLPINQSSFTGSLPAKHVTRMSQSLSLVFKSLKEDAEQITNVIEGNG